MEEKLYKDDINILDNICWWIMLKGVGKFLDVEFDFNEFGFNYFYLWYFDEIFFI